MTHKNKWVEEKIFEIEQILTECFDNDKYLWSVADKKLTSLIHSKVTQTQQDTLEWFKTLPSMRMEKKLRGKKRDEFYEKHGWVDDGKYRIRNALRQQILKELSIIRIK